jgi:predicted ribosome quality control (RQC) complex YloA/Tae2 family protein
MTPCLNWLELQVFIEKIKSEVIGLFVDRIIVPQRTHFPEGYLKGEWSIRLTGKRQEGALLFSIRPRHPYLSWYTHRGPQGSSQATRSPFDLALSKYIKGSRLIECSTLDRERIVTLWFSSSESENTKFGLILVFIPAAPEALLVSATLNQNPQEGWKILARSRTTQKAKEGPPVYLPPDGAQAPASPLVRNDLVEHPSAFLKTIEKELLLEAFQVRTQNAEKSIKHLLKQAQERLRQSQTAVREADHEPDWQKWGDLLKSTLGTSIEIQEKTVSVFDFTTEQTVKVPIDPKLSVQQQTEKFYQNSRRKSRRSQEAKLRISRFQETIHQLQSSLLNKPAFDDWKGLEKWEALGQTRPSEPTAPTGKKASSTWLGKSFKSKDNVTIWVGRSKDENLELTFKCARGNDMWMHVRGRPGAHVIIPLQAGKSVPLETLLDAANLVIHYSGGTHWGKTEVDYTFKKYVKRIKDSTEVSYTNNKTLMVEPDSVRKKRLLDQGA